MTKEEIEKRITERLSSERLTLIFVGPPGCGKKTMGEMLVDFLQKHDSSRKMVICEMGELFRNGIPTKPAWVKNTIHAIQVAGKLQSDTLAVQMWANEFERTIVTNDEHVILDGAPRTVEQVDLVFDYMEKVMDRKAITIHFELSDETARKRIAQRNEEMLKESGNVRMDAASPEAIENRISYYREQTEPLIPLIPEHMLITVDAEEGKDVVFQNMLNSISQKIARLRLLARYNVEFREEEVANLSFPHIEDFSY